MKYFINIESLADLKKKYRELAIKNHPDNGGDTVVMQEINKEYDELFPYWKKFDKDAVLNAETAESTRTEFYTQNGWAGSNYKPHQSTKDTARCIVTGKHHVS